MGALLLADPTITDNAPFQRECPTSKFLQDVLIQRFYKMIGVQLLVDATIVETATFHL